MYLKCSPSLMAPSGPRKAKVGRPAGPKTEFIRIAQKDAQWFLDYSGLDRGKSWREVFSQARAKIEGSS